MREQETKDQKLARLRYIGTGEDRFFHDFSQEIEAYLEDEDADVRTHAVACLWDYPEPAYIDVLIDIAENDPSLQVCHKAIVTLGRFIYEGEMADYGYDWGPYGEDELPEEDFRRVYDYLTRLIEDESRSLDERRYAVEALSFYHDPHVLDVIEQAYHHPEKQMRISAVFAMGRNGNLRRWEDYILEALYSTDPDLEFEAVRAAGNARVERANRQLMRIAADPTDKELRMAAIWSLGQLGLEESFETLDDLRFDFDPEIREVAEVAFDEWMIYSQLGAFDDDLDDDFFDVDLEGFDDFDIDGENSAT